jgi:VRR-NUC domain
MRSDKMSEADIMRLIQMEASKVGARLWRNNVGTAMTKNGSFITFGLCVGSSDLIGIYKGRFLAVEVKAKGKKPTPEQINFVDFINKFGGIAGVCYSVEDFLKLIEFID